MNQFSQKRLWACLVFTLMLGTAQAQVSNITFFIQGPEVVCPGTCDTFRVVSSMPNPGGSNVVVTNVTWTVSNGLTAQGNPALFCFDIPGATYLLFATGLASVNGAPFTFQTQPYTVQVLETCGFNIPFQITSNASSLCAANLPPQPVSPPPTGFALLLSDINGAVPGQQICMDIQAQNFFNMSGMSFSMQYDPARLLFASMTNVGLPGSTLFGLPSPPNSGTTDPGAITVSWSSPDQSITLNNGTVLFRLCFFVLPGSGCTTDVVFTNEPAPIRILRGSGEIVSFNSRSGRVQISNSSMGSDPNSASCCEKVCEGAVVQYNVDIPTGAIHPVTWSVQGAQSYTVNNFGYGVEVVWGTAGSGSVTAAVYDNTAQICVDILAIPEAGFTTNPPTVNDTVRLCRGQSLAFTNTTVGAESHRWVFGDGTSSTELNPVHQFEDAGLYRVALIAYNACLCSDTAFVMVQVDPAIAPQVTCRGTVCEGTAVTYTTDADCGTFIWTVSANGTITNGGGPADHFITIDWAGGQEGIITLQVSNCNNATYCPAPNELHVPVISESAQISGPEQVCRAQSAKYSITRFEGSEFTWSVSGMGNIQSGQGTHEVVVQWSGLLSTQPQWVAVEYYNCYLECGGRDTIMVNIRPEFAVSGPVEACLNSTQNYTARRTDNGANVPCNWEAVAGDGSVVWTSVAATAAPSLTWNFGLGSYRLIARPAVPTDFCIPLYEITVRVLDLPPALAIINGENVICPGQAYQYSGGGALPAHTLNWSLAGNVGPATLSGNPVTVQWAAAGSYTLSVRQVSPQGCVSPPLGFGASVLPAIAVSGPTDACEDERATYTATSFPQLDYQWSVVPAGAGSIYQVGNSASVEILWHRPGAATLQLNVCGQNISRSVTVHARPVPMVAAPASVCEGTTAMVSVGGAYAAYEWRNATDQLVSNVAAANLPAGYYQLIVTDNFGCAGSARFNMSELPAPYVSLTTPDNAGLCPGDPPSTLYATESEAGFSYVWLRDGSPIAGANASTFSTDVLGVYQVEATNANGCRALSNPLTLFFYCAPGGGGGFPGGGFPGGGGGNPSNCDPNTLIQFNIQATANCNVSNFTNTTPAFIPGTLSWNFGDPGSGADNVSTLENPTHTFSRAGFFRVALFGQVLNPTPENCYAIRVDTVPVAAGFYADIACAGAPAAFTDASTFLPGESIASRAWDFGDPASGADNNSAATHPTHVFATPGIYTITLTVTAANGCTAVISKTIEVVAPPTAAFPDPSVLCAATATPFIANVSADAIEFGWNFGDPASGDANASSLEQPFHRYENPGSYSVRLEATNIYGCTADTLRSITILPNGLSGSITFTSPICTGDSTLLTAPSGGVRWQWSTGDTTSTVWVRDAGIYTLLLTNADGCEYQPAAAVVNVLPPPVTAIRGVRYNALGLPESYTYDSLSVCVGEDVFLEVIAQTGQTYQWSTGQPGTNIEFSENRGNQLPVGQQDIFVTIRETATNCTNVIGPFRIWVRPLPNVPLVSASPAGVVCEGTPVSFNITNSQAGVNYSWSSGANGNTWTTERPGQYRAIATNEWGCANESAPQTVLAGPDIARIPSGCHSRCNPDTLCFPAVPGVNAYQWFFNGAAQGSASGSVPQIVITQSGAYYMRMTTTDGCVLDSEPLTVDLFDGYGSLRGIVYWDRNDNGSYDPADSLLTGVPLILLSGNTPLDTVLSQTGGQYGFANILSTGYGLQLDTAALPFGLVPDTVRIDTALVGCDVEVLVNWRVRCVNTTEEVTLQACPGRTVSYNGNTLTAGEVRSFTLVNAAGCDSTVTVTVNTLPTGTGSVTLQACPGGTATYNGNTLTAGEVRSFTLVNAAGCDSTVTVTVNTLPASTGTVMLQACPGQTVTYNGTTLGAGEVRSFQLVNAAGCDSTVTVTVNTLPASTGTVMLQACPGQTVTYNGTTLTAGEVRSFTLVNAAGCDSTVTVTVVEFPALQVQATAVESCPNRPSGSITVAATGQGPFSYRINGGAAQAEALFGNLASGTYNLLVQDGNGCSAESRATVTGLAALQAQVLNAELSCDADSVMVEAVIASGDDGQVQLLWDDGSTAAQRLITQPGDYRLTVINSCDTLRQTVQVRYTERPDLTPIFVPNAFSPNDDGINDLFRAFASTEVRVLSFDLMVADRWGNLMFRTQNPAEGWNGQLRERQMDPAVFVWHLKATVQHCGQIMELNEMGDVTLVR